MQRTESFKPIAILGAALALVLVIAGCRAKTAEETQALVDAKALLSFHDRLVTYMAVHKQAMAQLVAMGGHDHVYERIVPQHGILYFVMGSSGKLRSGDLENDALKAAGFDSTQSFLLMEITGDELDYQAISRTGQTVDSGVFRRPTPESNRSATPAGVAGGGGRMK